MDVCAYNLDNLTADPIHVLVNRRDTYLDLKTNLAIAGGFVIGDGTHDIEIQVGGLRKPEEETISYSIISHRKVYFKLCEEKHRYIHVHMDRLKRPLAVKVHEDDPVTSLCKKIYEDPAKVKFIHTAMTIPHDMKFKDTKFFADKTVENPYIYVKIEE